MASSTYPSYLRACDWPRTVIKTCAPVSLQGEQTCDAVIIGAGFTGISIARRLYDLNPNLNICIVEAETVGVGSSGRNSGFVLEHALGSVAAEKAAQIHKLYQDAHQDMMQFSGLDSLQKESHIFKAAATARGEKSLKGLASFLQKSGQAFEYLDASDLQQITGSSYYRSGLNMPHNRLVNPVDLITSLALQLPEAVSLYENSPVLSLEKFSNFWKVQTPDGSLKAPKVFLANNAFVKELGFKKAQSITIFTYAGITPVLNDNERAQTSSMGQWGLLPAHRLGTTFRTTDDGRLLVRGMYGYEKEGDAKNEDILLKSLEKRFPDMESARQLEKWWGGTTSLTANGAPIWGEIKAGLFCSSGCNGVGIVKGWLLGAALADQSFDKNKIPVSKLFGTPTWMPPEPFRKLGFLVASTIEKQMAGEER